MFEFGTAKVRTGATLTAIKNKLLRSHVVVVWVSGIDGFSNHALTLTGYLGNGFIGMIHGLEKTVSISAHEKN